MSTESSDRSAEVVARPGGQLRSFAGAALPVVVIWGAVVAAVAVEWLFAVAALLVVMVPLAFVARSTKPAMAQRWALDRGVGFDGNVIPQLHRHLVRTRLARTIGVTSFLALNLLLVAHYNADPQNFRWYVDEWNTRFDGLWLAGLGYVVATVWAEVRKPRDVTGAGSGVSLLAPARLRDFADNALVWLLQPMCAAVLIAGAVAFAVVAGDAGSRSARRSVIRIGDLWGGGAVAVLALVAAVLICRRSERSADATAVAYEELTRSASVNALLGVAIAMLGQVVGALIGIVDSAGALSRWLTVPTMLFFGWWPLGAWYAAGTKLVFRSRRMDAIRSAGRLAT